MTRKKICYHRSSVNVVDLISEEMACYKKQSDQWSKVIRNCNSRKIFSSIGNGVLKAKDSNTLSEFGGHITLTDDWDRGILRSMDWFKRIIWIG